MSFFLTSHLFLPCEQILIPHMLLNFIRDNTFLSRRVATFMHKVMRWISAAKKADSNIYMLLTTVPVRTENLSHILPIMVLIDTVLGRIVAILFWIRNTCHYRDAVAEYHNFSILYVGLHRHIASFFDSANLG
jgi:hypothetical protein